MDRYKHIRDIYQSLEDQFNTPGHQTIIEMGKRRQQKEKQMVISREEYLELIKLRDRHSDNIFPAGLFSPLPMYRTLDEDFKPLSRHFFIEHGYNSAGMLVSLNLNAVNHAIYDFEQSYQEVYKKFL